MDDKIYAVRSAVAAFSIISDESCLQQFDGIHYWQSTDVLLLIEKEVVINAILVRGNDLRRNFKSLNLAIWTKCHLIFLFCFQQILHPLRDTLGGFKDPGKASYCDLGLSMGRLKAPETEYTPSDLPADHRLVVLGVPRGSNNFECTDVEGVQRLVEIGSKLRKLVLAVKGDYAFIKLFPDDPEPSSGGTAKQSKLAGEIIALLTPKEVKGWKKSGEWPRGFDEPVTKINSQTEDVGDEEDRASEASDAAENEEE